MLFNRNCGCNRQIGNAFGFGGGFCNQPMMEQPVIEPTINKCIEKEFYHEVPHCCPIHTHTINKHIYTHTYTPQYSCSEENVVVNNDCGSCSGLANQGFNNTNM